MSTTSLLFTPTRSFTFGTFTGFPSGQSAPRQVENGGGSSKNSLIFGFSFVAILVFCLTLASMAQRWVARRRRLLRGLLLEVQEKQNLEEKPQIWDVYVDGKEKSLQSKRWMDMQPFAAGIASASLAHNPTFESPHIHASMIILMPQPSRDDLFYSKKIDDPDAQFMYEIGIAKICTS